MQLSIIIPVFNAEKYLSECLDSVLNQTFSDFELICINDGSTDNSAQILEAYKQKDSRIKVIHQSNGGVSAARNAGLDIAKGEYIGFVDADDTISPSYFYGFLQNATEDLVASLITDANEMLALNTVLDKEYIQRQVIAFLLKRDDLNSVCLKIFSRNIIERFHLRFPLGMALGEDAHFTFSFLGHANAMRVIDASSQYHYRENLESATKQDVKDGRILSKIFWEYEFDHKAAYNLALHENEVLKCKQKRLLSALIASLSLFLRESRYLGKKERHNIVRSAMQKLNSLNIWDASENNIFTPSTKFEKFILQALRKNNFPKVKWAYKYAHWRNGIK